jgi:hypothetical protein
MITTTTTAAGITNNCTTNPADGGSTGGKSGRAADLSPSPLEIRKGSLGWSSKVGALIVGEEFLS